LRDWSQGGKQEKKEPKPQKTHRFLIVKKLMARLLMAFPLSCHHFIPVFPKVAHKNTEALKKEEPMKQTIFIWQRRQHCNDFKTEHLVL
jgi:hypothetical protein